MLTSKHVIVYSFSLLLAALLSSACRAPLAEDRLGEDRVFVRVVHGSPDMPSLDVYIPGSITPVVQGLGYKEVSDYLSLKPGMHKFAFRPEGADPDAPPVFTAENTQLDKDQWATALVAGLLDSSAAEDEVRMETMVEGFDASQSGSAHIRIVNASPDAPTVAIDVGNDGSPEVTNLQRYSSTDIHGLEVDADVALQIGVLAGEPLEAVTAFTTPALPAGSELFLFAMGHVESLPRESDGLSLLAVDSQGLLDVVVQNPSVLVLHGVPDAPAVALSHDGKMLATDLDFGELTTQIQLPPGSHDIDFFVASDEELPPTMPFATITAPELEAGQRYLATATGLLDPAASEPDFQLIWAEEEFALDDPDNARIAFMHASPDMPTIDASNVSEGLLAVPSLFENLSFGKLLSSQGVAVEPGRLMLGIAPASDRFPRVTTSVEATAGMRAFIVALGLIRPQGEEMPLALFEVDTTTWPWSIEELFFQ